MAFVRGDVDQRQHSPTGQAAMAVWTALAEYVVPPEVIFKEWYLSSSTSDHSRIATFLGVFPYCGLLTGSRTEALSVPDLLVIRGDGSANVFTTIKADYDRMYPTPNRLPGDQDDATRLIALEPIADDPRYYRLMPSQHLRDTVRQRHPSYDGGYVPNRYFTVAHEESSASKSVGVHGPAVFVNEYVRASSQGVVIASSEQDLVDSIQLDAWPAAIAADWLRRFRQSGWPDERLARDVVITSPVFVTPTGRSGSPTDEAIEWRLSFSLPERQLALSLTAAQRTAYLLVKMLMKAQTEAESGADGGVGASSFRTFYLKNALFWACETEPADTWRRPADGARKLLTHIERCATDGRLPSYFVPSSNLLDREPAEALLAAAGRARRLLEQPLDALRLVATSRSSFLSLGIIDYEPLWRWIDAELLGKATALEPVLNRPNTAQAVVSIEQSTRMPAIVSDEEHALTILFASYVRLLNQTELYLASSVDDDRRAIARIAQGLITSVAGRLAVDIYWYRQRQHVPTIGGGRYVLSREMSSFEAFVRSLLEAHGVACEDLVLHSRALLRIRLRGGHELSSGSFAPVAQSHIMVQYALSRMLENNILQMLQKEMQAKTPRDTPTAFDDTARAQGT